MTHSAQELVSAFLSKYEGQPTAFDKSALEALYGWLSMVELLEQAPSRYLPSASRMGYDVVAIQRDFTVWDSCAEYCSVHSLDHYQINLMTRLPSGKVLMFN